MIKIQKINRSDSNIFGNARIKLTAWYLLIIMFISTFFSVAIYRVLISELDRVGRMQRTKIEHGLPEEFQLPPNVDRDEVIRPLFLDPILINETKNRIALILAMINLVIIGSSAFAGYFLAGRTLEPIEEMLDEQKKFISDASHELRTPLTSLKTEIEVSLRDKKITLTKAKKILKSNLEEVNKMQQLSDYLLTLNRYQMLNQNLKLKTINIAKIAQTSIEKINLLAKVNKITFEKRLQKANIKANEESILELIMILLDNAIKFSFKGGKIIVKTFKKGDFVLIEIQDFGTGIGKNDFPHIFDRFYRADTSRNKSKTEGYGLGLSIAKKIVDIYEGNISVISSPNKGSTFKVSLPIN